MPKKTCPKCNAKHGVRRLKCDCGYDFGRKRTGKASIKAGEVSHPLYPEPGGWVIDTLKGMPPIDSPEPLLPGPIDVSVIKDHVLYDGLGFCIYTGIPIERISDSKLKSLWREARRTMQRVVEYLEDIPFSEE